MFWTFEPEHQEAVQIWKMINFDKSSITVEQLDDIVAYGEDADVEVEKENGKTKVWIYNYYDQSEYTIFCEQLALSKRPYNSSELTKMILTLRQRLHDEGEVVYSKNQLIDGINKFLVNEITKKERIMADKIDKNSNAYIKAHGQLNTLKQLKTIIETFNKK